MQTTYEMVPAAGVEGMLDASDNDTKSMYNGEASAAIPFGRAVKRGSTTDGRNAKAMAANTDSPCGIVSFSQAYENGVSGDLNSTGILPGGNLNVCREGRIYVTCEDGCNAGDRLWIRGSGGAAGALRSTDAGSSTCFDATKIGEWQTAAAAGSKAWLEVDFSNKA